MRSLLAEAGVPDADALVDVLLAPLAAEVYRQQRADGIGPAAVTAALARLAHGVLGNVGPPP